MADILGILSLDSAVFTFMLPWLFTFAVVYGLLARANLFGGQNSRVSAVIGLVIAFFVAGYYGPSIAVYFASLFGGATYVLAAILVVILFIAMAGFDIGKLTGEKGGRWPVLLLLIVVGIIIFMAATGTVIPGVDLDQDTLAMIFVLIIILLAVWFVAGKGEEKQPVTLQVTPKGGEGPG